MAERLGIIGDDFTGAMLIAGELEAAGVPCPILFTPAAMTPGETAPVLMLATRARVTPRAEARKILADAAAAFAAAGYARLAYKACASFDSTESGNIGTAADFLAARAGTNAILSAGAPRYNVTVFEGHLFYRGALVSDSIKRFDPLTPMTDPNLPRFLSHQTERPIALLPHSKLIAGIDLARQALAEARAQHQGHVLADTADDNDVAIAVQLAIETGAPVVASDPMIFAYARQLAGVGDAASAAAPAMVDGPAAVLVGSVGPVALGHLARFEQAHPVLRLDLQDPRAEEQQVADALAWADAHLGRTAFAVTTAAGAEGVDRAQAAFGVLGAARKAEALLAAIAHRLYAKGAKRIVVAGGETSGAVVAALGLARARALPAGALGGGFCIAEGPSGPVALYLKSGKLGAADILERALDFMTANAA
ncbi:four-carbon acid sugar kinase family protein [Dongia sp. agr-C8]